MTTPESEWQYPYGTKQRYHLQHVHLFASNVDATIDFYKKWFDAEVMWDGDVAGARNVFIKVGIGALHLYDQLPRGHSRATASIARPSVPIPNSTPNPITA